jgi:four helix bundle protein
MDKVLNNKQYDLEDRTLNFAKRVRALVKKLAKTVANIEDGKQVIRSSGSVGANYIEANESLSKKDFLMRIKISRKEAKESKYWLILLDIYENKELEAERQSLTKEAVELMMIFSSIMRKTQV